MNNHGTTKYGKPSQAVCLQYQLVVDLYIHHSGPLLVFGGPLGDINKLYFLKITSMQTAKQSRFLNHVMDQVRSLFVFQVDA